MGKRKFFLAIDTETAGSIAKPLVYDVGFKVFDLSGKVYERFSFVNYDIYTKKDIMNSAYYAEKLPQYEADLKAGTRKMVKFFTIRKKVIECLQQYDVEAVCAYNTAFDRRALNNTFAYLTDNKYRFFFPYGTKFIDIWNMTCSSIFQTRSFYNTAYENNWYSPTGNVRTNAEVAYSFITKRFDFVESHTALEDVDIEQEIFLYCWKKTKEEHRFIVGCPWRKPQKDWYYIEACKDGVI